MSREDLEEENKMTKEFKWLPTDEEIKGNIITDDSADIFKPLTCAKSTRRFTAKKIAERLDNIDTEADEEGEFRKLRESDFQLLQKEIEGS